MLARFGRVRAVVEPDDGQAAAVNKGIASTAGGVIGWLNSDDVYAPGALQVVVAYFADTPRSTCSTATRT